jgi:hypothetical protein
MCKEVNLGTIDDNGVSNDDVDIDYSDIGMRVGI